MKHTQAIATRLKALMAEKEVTEEELVSRSRLPLTKVRKILNEGYQSIALNDIFVISWAMGISLKDFFDDKELFSIA